LDTIFKLLFDFFWLIGKGFINIFKGLKKCTDIKLFIVLVALIIASILVKNAYVFLIIYLITLGIIKPKEISNKELEEKLYEIDNIILEIEDLKDNIYLDKREIKKLKKNKTLKELKNYTKGYIKTRAKKRHKFQNLNFVIGDEKIKFGGMKKWLIF